MTVMRSIAPLLLLCLLCPAPARAALGEDSRTQLKVMATSVPVRSGPGGSYREVGRVGMGQVFTAIDRSPDGAWYRIRLARGTSGWVLSELVWPFEIVDEGALAGASDWLHEHILGSSRLAGGNLSLAVAGGVLGSDGYFTLRLGYQPSRHYLLELTVGQSAGGLGNILTYTAEILLTLGPWRSIVPFVAVGGGGATFMPHRNVEIFQLGTNPLLSAGGGIMIQLHGSIILRVDARHMMLFSPHDTWNALAIVGGAMLTF